MVHSACLDAASDWSDLGRHTQVRSLPLLQFQQQYTGDIEAALLARVTGRLEVTPGRSGQSC